MVLILLVLAIVIVAVDRHSALGSLLLAFFKGVIGLAVIFFLVAVVAVGIFSALILHSNDRAIEQMRKTPMPVSTSAPRVPPAPPRPLFRGRLPGPAMSTHSAAN